MMPKRRHDPLQEAFDATPEQLGYAAVRAARAADDGPNYDAEYLRELSDNIANWNPLRDREDPRPPRIVDSALLSRQVRDKRVVNVELPDVIEVEDDQ